ncbi:hypothetical protein [Nonomuraea sp. NPDC049709]|uniref:hypothetical protein n=1 Tax=Nonomuraea sp. NPDC049709 TaxID=3154736 RepID=UPI0034203D44
MSAAENSRGSPGGVGVAALGQAGIGVYTSGQQAALQLGRVQFVGPPTASTSRASSSWTRTPTSTSARPTAQPARGNCSADGPPGTRKLLG